MSKALAQYELSVPQRLYLWLACFFCACLLIADLVGIKLFTIPLPFSFPVPWQTERIDAITHTCGMLTFPVTFLLTDLINEYYGKKGARRVTWIGLVMGIFVFGVMNLAQAMPYLKADYNVKQEAFDAVFGSAKIMYVSSLLAYLAGQFCDIAAFSVIKRFTGGRMIWLRATGSTVISQLIDSFVVTYFAFHLGRRIFTDAGPVVPFVEILKIALTGYLLKFAIAVAITPLIYAGHNIMHRWFGLTPLPPDMK
ncbi:MAG: queuosine precursor transporter [Planctomycetes bacterium]|nr:queuosine precursor transporter [Planctomycetota bacterium]